MKTIATLLLLCLSLQVNAQQILNLWPDSIPNSTGYQMKEVRMENNGLLSGFRSISLPTLAVYLPNPATATGAAMIICPGGGYGMESYRMEGTNIAEACIRKWVAAFILKYRLPSDSIMKDKSIGPLQDAQQAIRMVRMNASKWKINPSKVGIIGFSAGGHLASTAGTHFDKAYIPNPEQTSLRPDFMVLVYPVISMTDELAHIGSRNNLLGRSADAEKIMLFSNEFQVKLNTPPTWITHTGDDRVVAVENSIRFYQALVKYNVPTEMHLYPAGNHGFVLKLPTDEWMAPIFVWLKKIGF